jgi:molecular chaperone DnaJ
MTLDEAYSELGLAPGASKEEINQAFRKLAKEWHPDKNKSPEAEDKFKRINSAKTLLENPPPEQGPMGMPFGFGDFGGRSMKQPKRYPDPIVDVNLTFIEAMLGKQVHISYEKYVKCEACNGQRTHTGHDKCKACDGKGGKFFRRGNMQTGYMCPVCGGSGKEEINCDKCNGDGVNKVSVSGDLNLPFPLRDRQIIGAGSGGNYLGMQMNIFGQGGEVYGDLRVQIHVESDSDMRLSDDGENIESDVSVSLLDSLKGTSVKVKTINGEKNLKIPAETKNGTKMRMAGFGPGNQNNHIFHVNIEYPKDISKLIGFLEDEFKTTNN